ncbi:hypothetical protein HPB51_014433 [Rhipicephalus microplus]|uniref:Endonuclease/exonuclease/phosphatase domain-containing protein n=1 Tax=Rhipicephalus microplus TaxID=6941 RepID=A0A9J6D5F9_RHIMP|nr:hypothetical protein HPB51_014433 [Rhipicephalus microplus]
MLAKETTFVYKKGLEMVLVEILPHRAVKRSIFVLNVYSPPSDKKSDFNRLLTSAVKLAGDNPLIVAGDLYARSTEYGYLKNEGKRTKLAESANALDLQLINNLALPSRKGNSVQRDKMSDLTFTKNVRATWDNLAEDLGSDPCVLETTVENEAKAPREFKITDWDQFRKTREEKGNTELSSKALLNELKMAANAATKDVETDESIQVMDSHLARLLQKKT